MDNPSFIYLCNPIHRPNLDDKDWGEVSTKVIYDAELSVQTGMLIDLVEDSVMHLRHKPDFFSSTRTSVN